MTIDIRIGFGGRARAGLPRRFGDAGARRRIARSDDDVLLACSLALAWTAGLPEGTIGLEVDHGKAILDGTVEFVHQREVAESVVRGVPGVLAVVNRVRVRSCAGGSGAAADIRLAAFGPVGDGSQVDVDVDGACVVLRGRAVSRAEHEALVAAAWAMSGVAHVIDEVTVPTLRSTS